MASVLDRLFLSVLVPPRGGNSALMLWAERLFLCLSLPPSGGIFGENVLSLVLTWSFLRLSPDRLFLLVSAPPRRGYSALMLCAERLFYA